MIKETENPKMWLMLAVISNRYWKFKFTSSWKRNSYVILKVYKFLGFLIF
jgi:hypothetical protein